MVLPEKMDLAEVLTGAIKTDAFYDEHGVKMWFEHEIGCKHGVVYIREVKGSGFCLQWYEQKYEHQCSDLCCLRNLLEILDKDIEHSQKEKPAGKDAKGV